MKKRLIGLLKLLLVVALMAYILRDVHFGDRLLTKRGKVVVAEQAIQIDGSWKTDPVAFRIGDAADQRHVAELPVPDDCQLEVAPGFLTYWRNLDPWLFALGAFCYFLTALIAGARWWWLLRVNGTDVTLSETLRFTWVGIFFNTVVPGATGGDVIKALYIMKRCPGHRVQVLVSVIVDRVLGLASLAVLGGVVVLFALDKFAEVALGIWGVIAGVGIVGVFAFSRRLRERIRLKALIDRLPPKVGHLLRLLDQAVYFYRDHKGVIGASLLAGIGNHVLSVFSVVFIGDALGIDMPWLEYFALVPVINILSAVPVAPNGWGYGDLLYKYLFGTYGAKYLTVANAAQVMGVRGFALSVLYRLHLTFWSLLGGLFVLFEKDRVTKADIERETQQEEQEDRE
ncbi:MAG: lysylphosphatidylglycerol synthase transmembrane domain-containing protein [Planctomycetota bacterium]